MEKDPPVYSSGLSLLSRARVASSLTVADISGRLLVLAALTMGVMRPPGVATAMEMSAASCSCALLVAASHVAFTSGTSISASAAARTTKSFTLTLLPCAFSVARISVTAARSTCMRMYIAGMVVFDSSSRLAITRRICDTGTSTYSRPPSVDEGVGALLAEEGGGACLGGVVCLGVGLVGEGFVVSACVARSLEGGLATASSASPFVTIPFGPVPQTSSTLMPAPASKRRAAGLARPARERSPISAGVSWAGASPGEVVVVVVVEVVVGVQPAIFAMSSRSSTTTASGVPVGMSFAPASTNSAAMKPSSWFSNGSVALSVSISANTCPAMISSPAATLHDTRFPFSIVGDSAGMSSILNATPGGGAEESGAGGGGVAEEGGVGVAAPAVPASAV
mmetsp:Transcript_6924/g.12561  ORF Transcript_6924/g.12561 Transcript_6924/m.12561 type:complete len:395 (+) Transcript_6924:73-1257(+)